ncbi:ectoine/hydroxyectoine ABC transporter ATP-binding protein EhuA [Brooklawnia cerclae]|uniref:amino acid ABC transporter ATP-binding protein n=1 Tax=Brooklawnia cerclae TaxID=349934 RepID=UPI0031D0CDDB
MSIRFENVSKAYGDHVVLDNLSFEVGTSERVTLIGPSGSGKTTILRMLMTLERPDSGRVSVNDEVLWDAESQESLSTGQLERRLAPIRRNVGMVFQQFNLFPNMSVLQNVASPMRFTLKVDRDAADKRAMDLLDSVGLSAHASKYPGQLSGGQQQRVAIARALGLNPQVMLFDEVTSALDPELVGEVTGVIKNLAETSSMTMLFVTHQMEFAAGISDRVLMFDAGAIVEDKPPRELFENPAEARTQQFLSAVRHAL